jgi:sirohydrochlorin ferrochelatase
MRKFSLALLLLLLTACAPVVSVLFGDSEQGSLGLEIGRESTKVTFAAGNQDAEEVALYIGGSNLSVDDDKCEVVENGIGCTLGTVAAETSYEITVRGSKLSANVTYYRPGSSEPLLLLAQVQ